VALEIVDVAGLEVWIADPARTPAVFVDLDLRTHEAILSAVALNNCVILGGTVTPAIASQAAAQGATVLGRRADVPFDMYRPDVYTVAGIYAGFDPFFDGLARGMGSSGIGDCQG